MSPTSITNSMTSILSRVETPEYSSPSPNTYSSFSTSPESLPASSRTPPPYNISPSSGVCQIQQVPTFHLNSYKGPKVFQYSEEAKTLIPHKCQCSPVREENLRPLYSLQINGGYVIVCWNSASWTHETYVLDQGTGGFVQVDVHIDITPKAPLPFFAISENGHFIVTEGDGWVKKVRGPQGTLEIMEPREVRTFEGTSSMGSVKVCDPSTLPQWTSSYCEHAHRDVAVFRDTETGVAWVRKFNMTTGEFQEFNCPTCMPAPMLA